MKDNRTWVRLNDCCAICFHAVFNHHSQSRDCHESGNDKMVSYRINSVLDNGLAVISKCPNFKRLSEDESEEVE